MFAILRTEKPDNFNFFQWVGSLSSVIWLVSTSNFLTSKNCISSILRSIDFPYFIVSEIMISSNWYAHLVSYVFMLSEKLSLSQWSFNLWRFRFQDLCYLSNSSSSLLVSPGLGHHCLLFRQFQQLSKGATNSQPSDLLSICFPHWCHTDLVKAQIWSCHSSV